MKALKLASGLLRTVFFVAFGVVLLAAGIILVLYSPWGQEKLRSSLVDALNRDPDTQFSLSELHLSFPLDLRLAGVALVQKSDTLVAADTIDASVGLMPLLAGEVKVSRAMLSNGYFQLGNADSLMWMRVRAQNINLKPTSVKLSTMDIDLSDASISDGMVDMVLRPDSVYTPPDTAKTAMAIKVKRLQLDRFTYKMSMLPTIDSLGTTMGHAVISDCSIDLTRQNVAIKSIIGNALSAAYIAPDAATAASVPVAPEGPDSVPSEPWTIEIDSIRFVDSQALYTTRGVTPQPGLDFAYIQASDMDLSVDDFYNQAATLRMPLRLSATERCGVRLDASGTFSLDSAAMRISDFDITTAATNLKVNAMMGLDDMLSVPSTPLALQANGQLAFADLKKMFPGYAPYIALLPAGGAATLNIDTSGSPAMLNLREFFLSINDCVRLKASGALFNIFADRGFGADIALKGNIYNVSDIVDAFVDKSAGLKVPPMTLDGNVAMRGPAVKGRLTATTLGGRVALDGHYNSDTDGFAIDLDADNFPLEAFMPQMGLGKATLTLKAKGNTMDVLAKNAAIDANAHIALFEYEGYQYRDLTFAADLEHGNAKINARIDNPDLKLSLDASGNLDGDVYRWTADIDGEHIDMQGLHLSETPMSMSLEAQAQASYTPAANEINARVHVPEFYFKGDEASEFAFSDIEAHLMANDTLTDIDLHNRDLIAHAQLPMGLNKISLQVDTFLTVIDKQIAQRVINVDSLQRAMPKFTLNVVAGDDNLLNDFLEPQKMSIGHLSMMAENDSTVNFYGSITSLATSTMVLDTLALQARQMGQKLHILSTLDNRPGNLDEFAHVKVDGMLNLNNVSLRITQRNAADEIGYDLGAIALLADSVLTARFFPLTPTIGYKKWTVNMDNYLRYDFADRHIDANLKMKGDDSSLQLFTNHHHSPDEDPHEYAGDVNDITLKISDIHLSDWISFNPFAPPISGNLSADINLLWDGGTDINGKGNVRLDDFLYDNRKVASLLVDLDVETNISGTVRAKADLIVDGERTMTLAGNLNDSEASSPFNLDFSVIRFPLNTLNPFLPEDMAQLTGALNGSMMISGDSEHPLINGEISFDQASIKVPMIGAAYSFSEVKIPVVDNLVTFKDFNVKGANNNPLYLNGTVDIANMASPKYDLAMKARNMMILNTQKAQRSAVLFGKGYIDLDVTAKGNLDFMRLDADLKVLSGTNLTYLMTESAAALTSYDTEGMVKFVNLSDSSAVAVADSLSSQQMLMALDATLTIQNGTTINVELPSSGPGTSSGKVQVSADGSLNYTLTPMQTEGRLFGRLNINSGFARYTLPVVGSEKRFDFSQGSYIAFNGNMLDPILNIHASDMVRANVTQEGQNSRLVDFDIKLGITGTLDRMDVAFDLSTDDDLTVANELQSMTAEQRANQAMNMLLYNMYTGPGTTASGNLAGNPLYSFLESALNSWAANNIKGVDLSFGIDQYNKTTNGSTASTMTYSYQVSKSLFNDRFKIVVGGNYSTDNNADENLAENLINDISFEYFLNKQQTMLVRLFRHTGYESILEGEVVQTGVGFVYRRKLDRLTQMLPKFIRPRYKDPVAVYKEKIAADSVEVSSEPLAPPASAPESVPESGVPKADMPDSAVTAHPDSITPQSAE